MTWTTKWLTWRRWTMTTLDRRRASTAVAQFQDIMKVRSAVPARKLPGTMPGSFWVRPGRNLSALLSSEGKVAIHVTAGYPFSLLSIFLPVSVTISFFIAEGGRGAGKDTGRGGGRGQGSLYTGRAQRGRGGRGGEGEGEGGGREERAAALSSDDPDYQLIVDCNTMMVNIRNEIAIILDYIQQVVFFLCFVRPQYTQYS